MAKTPENIDKYKNEYDEKKFWDKLPNVTFQAGMVAISRALLLYYSISNTPAGQKALICGALGYLILLPDLVPDLYPLIGFADDLAALMFVYKKVRDNITATAKDKTRVKLKELYPSITEEELKKLGV